MQIAASDTAFPVRSKATSTRVKIAPESLRHEIDLLLNKTLQGDEKAFEMLFDQTYDMLCHLANAVIKSRMLAEEIVTDVFARLWTKRELLHIKGSGKSYLMVAVRNQALDYRRKYHRDHDMSELDRVSAVASPEADPLELAQFDELYQKVQKGIALLPTQCRAVFECSRLEGLKYKEIASKMGISIKTVETQVGRALKHLRTYVLESD